MRLRNNKFVKKWKLEERRTGEKIQAQRNAVSCWPFNSGFLEWHIPFSPVKKMQFVPRGRKRGSFSYFYFLIPLPPPLSLLCNTDSYAKQVPPSLNECKSLASTCLPGMDR